MYSKEIFSITYDDHFIEITAYNSYGLKLYKATIDQLTHIELFYHPDELTPGYWMAIPGGKTNEAQAIGKLIEEYVAA
jgi:hypothetical protein